MEPLIKDKEVARILNKPIQAIQAWIRFGTFPGGYYYKREGTTKGTYQISRKIFYETFGGADNAQGN